MTINKKFVIIILVQEVIPIKSRYFSNTNNDVPLNFARWVKGIEVAQDAILELDQFKKSKHKVYIDPERITRALENQDVNFLRDLSNYFYGISGIYERFVKYLAGILTYDWYAYPYMLNNYNKKTITKEMNNVLNYLDNINIKTTFYNISQSVILNGSFYGYMINNNNNTVGTILELPAKYCRSRYNYNGLPAVEFNVKYFDEEFTDEAKRMIVLKSFPKEFLKNYNAFKNGSLEVDREDKGAWFLCDTNLAMKFSLLTKDVPFFSAVIPTIIDLDKAKQLDMKKTMQELLKIIIQKMPLDKNSEMVFDLDEAQAMHNNVCRMLNNAVNVDVLTTFGDIDSIDLDNSKTAASNDPLSKVERGIFNEAGVSQMLFATNGNIALEKSILNDEALMFYLLGQYEQKLNEILISTFSKGKNKIKISFPRLSIYNKEKMQKVYKDQATAGYSKLLPAISVGMSQTEFLSMNEYENNILNLNEKMTPVQISSTQSAKNSPISESEGKVGAPEKDDSEKAEKTIQNKESQS